MSGPEGSGAAAARTAGTRGPSQPGQPGLTDQGGHEHPPCSGHFGANRLDPLPVLGHDLRLVPWVARQQGSYPGEQDLPEGMPAARQVGLQFSDLSLLRGLMMSPFSLPPSGHILVHDTRRMGCSCRRWQGG
jgi:hypothetical protein